MSNGMDNNHPNRVNSPAAGGIDTSSDRGSTAGAGEQTSSSKVSNTHGVNSKLGSTPAVDIPGSSANSSARKRGRPVGSVSTIDRKSRPHRLGRPPGTGYLQKARANAGESLPKVKRPVGRPRKVQKFGGLTLKPGSPMVCSNLSFSYVFSYLM